MKGFAVAPPATGCSTGRLDLDEAALGQEPAHRGDRREPDVEDAPRVVVRDEVDVALAVARVGVGEAVPLLGQRPQRLREQLERRDVDRELAELGLHDLALDADPVAAVDLVAEPRERVLAELALTHEELQLAGSVAHLREDQPALRALQQHPARDAHDVVGRSTRVDLVVPVLAHLLQGVRAVEADRVRIVAARADLVDLGESRREFVLHQRFRSKMIRRPNKVSHGS